MFYSLFPRSELSLTCVLSDPISSGQLKCVSEHLYPSMLAADVFLQMMKTHWFFCVCFNLSTNLTDTPLSQGSLDIMTSMRIKEKLKHFADSLKNMQFFFGVLGETL